MTIIPPFPFQLVNGTTADATQVMADLNQVINNVNSSFASVTGTGNWVLNTSPTLISPNLGTPTTLVGTNITGTASSFTAGAVTNGIYSTDTGTVTNSMLAGGISNANLSNDSITINGFNVALGGSVTGIGAQGNLTGPIKSIGLATSFNTNPENIPNGWTATTQASTDNSTQIATTAFVQSTVFQQVGRTSLVVSGEAIILPADALPVFIAAYAHGSVYGISSAALEIQGSAAASNKVLITALSYENSSTAINQMFQVFSNTFSGSSSSTWYTVGSSTTLTITTNDGAWNNANSDGTAGAGADIDIVVWYILT